MQISLLASWCLPPALGVVVVMVKLRDEENAGIRPDLRLNTGSSRLRAIDIQV